MKSLLMLLTVLLIIGSAVVLCSCGGKATGASSRGVFDSALSEDSRVSVAEPPPFDDYGSFIDERDGQTYRTVVMPDGKTWMAENLNYKNPTWAKNDVVGEIAVGDKGSWCYNNSADSCKKYGRLYTWEAAMEACPAGWYLPSDDDWTSLVNAVGWDKAAGTKLKSKTNWLSKADIPVGMDDYGFSALPGGYCRVNGSFGYVGLCGYWWTVTVNDADFARNRCIRYDNENVLLFWGLKRSGLSVRCVMDE